MGATKRILRKLETNHPEGLSGTELFLASEDLLPVTEDKKTWDYWNFVSFFVDPSRSPLIIDILLDRRQLQPQHLHHRLVNDHRGTDLVAGEFLITCE